MEDISRIWLDTHSDVLAFSTVVFVAVGLYLASTLARASEWYFYRKLLDQD